MPADFSLAAKHARLQIAVPTLDIAEIRERSTASSARARLRSLALSIAVSLGIVGSAVALASMNQGIHVWIFGNTFQARIQSFAQVRAPMASDVERIAESAAFSVTLPEGVPEDYRVMWIAYTPADHPTFITVRYQTPSDKPGMSVTVIQTSSIERNPALLAQTPGARTTTHGHHFEVGGETVLVQGLHVTDADASAVQRAMASATRQHALADLESHLTRLVVLAPVPSARFELAAERLAPRSGKNFLLARWALHELPARAAHNQPLRDPRTVQATIIPGVRGGPDYRNATLKFARPVAIPADGVQIVAAALRRARIGPNCNCAILVHQSGGSYAIWKIGAAPSFKTEKLNGR